MGGHSINIEMENTNLWSRFRLNEKKVKLSRFKINIVQESKNLYIVRLPSCPRFQEFRNILVRSLGLNMVWFDSNFSGI